MLVKLSDSFILAEKATKYTEIGYHGQNVDQFIIDLLKSTIKDAEKGIQDEFDRRESEVCFNWK